MFKIREPELVLIPKREPRPTNYELLKTLDDADLVKFICREQNSFCGYCGFEFGDYECNRYREEIIKWLRKESREL